VSVPLSWTGQNVEAVMLVAARPTGPTPSGANSNNRVPPEAFDIPVDTDASGVGKTCPHCTYVNPFGVSDCEICGLPLT
jgi:hypothetical protein